MGNDDFLILQDKDLAVSELLKRIPPKNILFASDYSSLLTTGWTEIPKGNNVIIKSDLPLLVRINGGNILRDVYDMLIGAWTTRLEIQPQITSGAFPDVRVVIYSVHPGPVVRKMTRDVWDLPAGSTAQTITLAAGATSTTGAALNLSSSVLENCYLYNLRTAKTAGTGTQTLSDIDIIDNQGSPQVLWRRGALTSNANMFTFNDLPRVKLPNSFRFRLTHSSDAVNTADITLWPMYVFR